MFSYFPYAASFGNSEDGTVAIDLGLVGIALVIAPFVFVTLALVSLNKEGPKRVMYSMVLLIPIALSIGLLSPVVGATAAFGVGGALSLRRPDTYGVLRRRLWSVVVSVLYTLILLVSITPAGVFAGGVLPLLMIGFADEYTEWKATKNGQGSGSNPG